MNYKYKGQDVEIKSIGYNEKKIERQIEKIRKIMIYFLIYFSYGILTGLAIFCTYLGIRHIFS